MKKRIECPVCKRDVTSRLLSHCQEINNDEHKQLYEDQIQKIKVSFFDENINRKANLIEHGIFISYKQLVIMWYDFYEHKDILAREKRIEKKLKNTSSYNVEQKQINNHISLDMSWKLDNFKKLKNKLIKNKSLIPKFTKNPSLNVVNYDFDMRDGVCPICNEKFNKSFWNHLRIKQLDEKHQDILYQQVELAIRLFYDKNYISDNQNDDLNFYISYSTCRDFLWPNIFSKKENRKRASLMTLIGLYHRYNKIKIKPKKCQKWKFRNSRQRYKFNPLLKFDWKSININDMKDSKNIITYDDGFVQKINSKRCPICNKQFNRSYFDHLKLSRDDELHKKLFYEQIELAIKSFFDRQNNDISDNREEMFLSNFNTKIQIWNQLFEKKEIDLVLDITHRYAYGYRKDIDFTVRSSWEANIYRIFQYHFKDKYKESFDREIPFDISTPEKHQTYIVDIKDNFGLFAEPGTFIEIKGYPTEGVLYKKEMFEKLYHKKLIFIGQDDKRIGFHPDIYYSDLEKEYIDKIPLWETKDFNIKTRPDVFK